MADIYSCRDRRYMAQLQVAKPEVLMRSRQNCSKQEERPY